MLFWLTVFVAVQFSAIAPLPGVPAGTVQRYEYRYDALGNRTHARVVQAPPNWNGGSGGSGTNRSWAYGYDALQRLTDADRGTATAGGNPGDPIPLATTDVATAWSLDDLGNWTGVFDPDPPPGADIPGITITYAPGTANETVDSRSHAVFFDNSLESIKTQHGTANPVETAYVVNLVGSTVFDGTYYYEYDAWNRLIRVSDAGTVTAASFDARGVLLPPAPPPSGSGPDVNVPGDWRFKYAYDGLGRLARKESPVIVGGTEARREDYRYDGVRRIQEAVTRWSGAVVIPGGEEQGASGGTNPGEPGQGDPGAVTLGGLEEPVEATELEPFGEGTLLLALPEEWDQREYVWGPDYVDELAFQFDRDGRSLYALLDANYNVMAIVAGGVRPCGNIDADPYDDTVPAGTVLEQYVWSPYGELLALDLLIPLAKGESPRNRAGHQGLFFERFDAKNTDPPLVATDPITGEGKGWYYNRNRWYDATMGRFTTADPNETAMVALSSMAMDASAFDVMLGAASSLGQYGDGMNLFAYGSSNPLSGGDPSGLNWWDEDIDYEIADRTGHALNTLGTLNEAARWASIGLKTAMDIGAGFLPGSGLWDAFKSAKEYWETGQGGFFAAMDMAMVLLPGISAAKKAMGSMLDTRMAFRGMAGASRWGSAAIRACNRLTCFAPGTMIETPDGLVPIEWLRKNDWVLSRHESDPAGPLIPRRVSEVFQSSTSSIVWITLENGATLGVTPDHPMWESVRAGMSACELLVGDRLTTIDGSSLAIVEALIDATPVTVFNLEVAGT